ncbi:MFS transporter [Orrella sp. 11846]|uniref:MFS transporter n=1 Tax=Orrella sp. 11846 TaxID=3409913 RepID=UPI003B5BD91F
MSKSEHGEQTTWQPERFSVPLFLSFIVGYFLSYALRSVNATIAPLLADDLHLSAGALGWLTSSFFLAFASVQWQLGKWLDRFGARRTETVLLLIAALGSLIMGFSDSLAMLSIGRIFIGLGVSSCLMAPYSFFRRCYAPEKQAQLAMWMLLGGTTGSLSATEPALWLAQAFGWRDIFLMTSGLLVIAALAIFTFVPETDRQIAAKGSNATSAQPIKLLSLLTHPLLVRVIPTTIFFAGGFSALQTLWVGPWMTDRLGLSVDDAGLALFFFNLALMASYLLMSFASPFLEKRNFNLARQSLFGFYWFLFCMLLILLWRSPSAWWLWLLLTPGIPAVILMQTQTALLFPRELAGRVLTTYNLVMFSGAFAVQWGMGLVMDGFVWLGFESDNAMWSTFGLLFITQILSLVFFVTRRTPLPSRETMHG